MVLFLLVVVIDVLRFERLYLAKSFFDVAHNLKLRCRMECIARSPQQLHQVRSYVASTKINALGCVCDRVAFVDSTCMGHTISTVQNYTCR